MDQQKTLSFQFTPVDPATEGEGNPHAKETTAVPEVVEALQSEFGKDVLEVRLYANEHTVRVSTGRIVDVCRFLKDQRGFSYLVDIGSVDRFTEDERFEVFYNLVSIENGKRIRLKVRVEEEEPVVPSLTELFRAAAWNERECFDMLGIRFEGHPDLRRMFLPEDFEHHPQRKEFPLLGIPGSLPLPPQTPEGELNFDPFAAAHGSKPVKSYEEPESTEFEED
ncbi:MAG: NADH-quinone oxidoreductase subunit C [Rhodothermales bacterium]|nr:NADH-quinone oxidoreductase subunit C [Rhodothermales bacterium]